jgi:hypothetical protein
VLSVTLHRKKLSPAPRANPFQAGPPRLADPVLQGAFAEEPTLKQAKPAQSLQVGPSGAVGPEIDAMRDFSRSDPSAGAFFKGGKDF